MNSANQGSETGLPGHGKRDASRTRVKAALRQQRRRDRKRAEKVQSVRVEITPDATEALKAVAKLTGSSVKAETEALLKRTAPAYLREITALVSRAGAVWLQAAPYLPYAQFLQTPGAYFRVGEKTMTYADWEPIYTELTAVYAGLSKWGWSRPRIDAFLKRSARTAKTK